MGLSLADTGYRMASQRGKTVKDRRRNRQDRRNHRQRPEFPLRDSENRLVLEDRRRVPDRRTADIEVDWIEEDDNL